MSNLKIYDEYIIAPGETIEELLECNSMTQLDLADKTGINKKTINEIIKGKAPISTVTALKLEYVFNIPASFWNNLESNYRVALERKRDLESIKNDEQYLENIPYSEMAKRNWYFIEKTRDPYEKVVNLRKFFSVASLSFNTELKRKMAFRKSNKEKFSFESLYCWIRYGVIKSNKNDYSKFDVNNLKEIVNNLRMLTNNTFLSQINTIEQLLKKCGVAIVYEPHLPHTYVNGVAYKISSDKAMIMLSDKGKRDDILWFTFFHEIGHLIKHSKKEIFIDEDGIVRNNLEKEADEFSKNVLINKDNYVNFLKNGHFTKNKIKTFAKENNITPGILVGRLQKESLISWNEYNDLIDRI